MESITEKLKELNQKVALAVHQLKLLKEENELLVQENILLKENLSVQNEELKSFKNRDKITKIVSGVMGSEEKSAQLKHKLNEYIKEIDKCIAQLS